MTEQDELKRLQRAYQKARRKYRAVAPLGGPRADAAMAAFSQAAHELEQALSGQIDQIDRLQIRQYP